MRRATRNRLWIVAGLVALAALAFWTAADRPPRMPADPAHTLDQTEAHCLTCHGYGKEHPRPADHPLRDDCFSCHPDSRGVLHPRPGAPTEIPGGWRDDPRLAPRAGR